MKVFKYTKREGSGGLICAGREKLCLHQLLHAHSVVNTAAEAETCFVNSIGVDNDKVDHVRIRPVTWTRRTSVAE